MIQHYLSGLEKSGASDESYGSEKEILDTLKSLNKQLQDTRIANNRLIAKNKSLTQELDTAKKQLSDFESAKVYSEERMTEAVEVILALADLEFGREASILGTGDEYDALATGLKMLAEELQAKTISQHYLNDVIVSMSEILIVVDKTGIIETCNAAGKVLLGENVEGDTITSLPCCQLTEKEVKTHFTLAGIEYIIKNNESYQVELNVKNIEGNMIPLEVQLSPMKSREGVVIIARDIRERKAAEAKQKELVTHLENSNKELKQFAYITSHDLKAPLRGISMLAQWILEDSEAVLSTESKNNLAMLTKRVRRLYSFLEGVLAYSKIGLSKELTFDIDLNDLVNEVVDLLSIPTHINLSIDSKLPVVTVAKTHMIQVFQNLISNAIKYNDKEKGEVNIGIVEKENKTHFYIKDNGIGVDPVHYEKIFVIFQTLVPRDTIESTGIGLTIVKKIIEHYGGEIWLESEKGKGSCFWFTLNDT